MKYVLFSILILAFSPIYAQQKGLSPLPEKNINQEGSIYALIVGISDYQDPAINDLQFADKDAQAFESFLRRTTGLMEDDHIKLLINQNATMAQFAVQLDWLMENATENDRVYIYFSGHGDVEKKTLTQPGYLLCWDAPSKVYMAGGALALPMFQDVISTLSTQNKAKVIVILDACRSGHLSGNKVGGTYITGSNLAKQFSNEIKILSCQPDEFSIEGTQWGSGRGAFSYHLINGLYGFADQDNNQNISLYEIGRYLENKVPAEVAPISQFPMVVGNRNTIVATINPELFQSLKKDKNKELSELSYIQTKSLEENILANTDSITKILYSDFLNALNENRLIEPESNCAKMYFDKLIINQELTQLHSAMRRNFAAKLLDETQQYMNALIKANVKIIECQGFRKFIPRSANITLAAELLGPNHYLYPHLMARQNLCKAIEYYFQRNKQSIDTALHFLHKSFALDSSLPITHLFMERAYLKLDKLDSALYYMNICNEAIPDWIIPFTTLAEVLLPHPEHDSIVGLALDKAYRIDSTHPHISQYMAWKMLNQNNKAEALKYMRSYKENGGETYACWYGVLGSIYQQFQDSLSLAENAFLNAISLDSTHPVFNFNLGVVYMGMARWEEAEQYFLKASRMDPARTQYLMYLGEVYMNLKRFAEAEKYIDISFSYTKDTSDHVLQLLNLNMIYNNVQKVDSLISELEKSAGYKTMTLIKKGQWAIQNLNYKAALELFLNIIATKPNNRLSNIYLSYLFWRDAGYDQARKHSNIVLKHPEVRRLMKNDFEYGFLRSQSDYLEYLNWLDAK